MEWTCHCKLDEHAEPTRQVRVSAASWVTAMEAGFVQLFPLDALSSHLRCTVYPNVVLIRDSLRSRTMVLIPLQRDAAVGERSEVDGSMPDRDSQHLFERMALSAERLIRIDGMTSRKSAESFLCSEMQRVIPCESAAFYSHPLKNQPTSRELPPFLNDAAEFVCRTSAVVLIMNESDNGHLEWGRHSPADELEPKSAALFPVKHSGLTLGLVVLIKSLRDAGFSDDDMKLGGYVAGAAAEKMARVSRP